MKQSMGDVIMIIACGAIMMACGLFGLFYKQGIFTRAADHPRWIVFFLFLSVALVMLFLVIGRAAGIP